MTEKNYQLLEHYMHRCMSDSAHDKEHVYRVLYNALQIAGEEEGVNYDVLIAACLLHDIGRKAQFADPSVCHAQAGAQMAWAFLRENGFSAEFADRVRHCIETHRFRKAVPPQSLEAKILFDADKLDVVGAIGIARTLMYKGDQEEPLYQVLPNGEISDGSSDESSSFFREYRFKLEKLYGQFLTQRGAALALERQSIARDFYAQLYREVNEGRSEAKEILQSHITE